MAYRIEVKESAGKALAKLPKADQQRIQTKIDALAENPRPPGVKKLEGEEGQYRIRSGDYRVVYNIQDQVLLVSVDKIGHRSDVCRKRGGKRQRG